MPSYFYFWKLLRNVGNSDCCLVEFFFRAVDLQFSDELEKCRMELVLQNFWKIATSDMECHFLHWWWLALLQWKIIPIWGKIGVDQQQIVKSYLIVAMAITDTSIHGKRHWRRKKWNYTALTWRSRQKWRWKRSSIKLCPLWTWTIGKINVVQDHGKKTFNNYRNQPNQL